MTRNRPPKVAKVYRAWVQAAEEQGWELGWTGSGHPRLWPPKGAKNRQGEPAKPITFPLTPSDNGRGPLNTRRDFRRQGIDC